MEEKCGGNATSGEDNEAHMRTILERSGCVDTSFRYHARGSGHAGAMAPAAGQRGLKPGDAVGSFRSGTMGMLSRGIAMRPFCRWTLWCSLAALSAGLLGQVPAALGDPLDPAVAHTVIV